MDQTQDEQKQDADLQSDKQSPDLVVQVPAEQQHDSDQDPNKGDPSDKLTPDHPRFKDVLNEKKEAEERADQLERELAELKSAKVESTYEDDLSPEEAASLAKIKKALAKDGYVTQSDLRVEKNADTLRKLSEKYDGKGGLPAFDRAEIVAYSKKRGFGDNFEAAYRDMHFDTIVEVNAKKQANNPKAPLTEKPTGGGEATSSKRFSREDIKNMSDAEYDKYRIGLLNAIKPH